MNLAAGTSAGGVIGGFATIIVVTALYWLPSFIAWRRHVRGIGQVIVVNVFAFFFLIPWVIALVMAFRHVPVEPQSPGKPPEDQSYGYVPYVP